MFKKSFMVLSVVLAVLFLIKPCWADDDRVNISSKKYGELTGKWWQWAYSTGAAAAGSGDTDCSLGQRGKIWFLAGTFGTTEERTCIEPIPRGKALFLPLTNVEVSEDDCSDAGLDIDECTVEMKRQLADSIFSDDSTMSPLEEAWWETGLYACQLSMTVDGVPVQYKYPIVRIQSPPFLLQADPNAIADGFWVLVPPLPKGEHTIQFTGATCDISNPPTEAALFKVDVTYNFRVGRH